MAQSPNLDGNSPQSRVQRAPVQAAQLPHKWEFRNAPIQVYKINCANPYVKVSLLTLTIPPVYCATDVST